MSTTDLWLHNWKKFFLIATPTFRWINIQHVQSRSDDQGATMHILRGLKQGTDGWFLHTRTAFVFRQNRLIFHAYIHFKTLILLFKSFHEFFCHKNTLFSSYNFFFTNPLPPTPRKVTVMCVNVYKDKLTHTNPTPKKGKKWRAFYTLCT